LEHKEEKSKISNIRTGEERKLGENWEPLFLKDGKIFILLKVSHACSALSSYKSARKMKILNCDKYWAERGVA
jgi:hypothetical protein